MRLLKLADLMERLQLSKATVYRALKNDEGFPKPIRIMGSTRWRDVDVDAWLERKAA